jgi:hypothetical protein
MFCTSCGTEASSVAAFCPNCGEAMPTKTSTTPESARPATSAPASSPAASVSPAIRFHLDLGRWSQTDRISGGATLVLFISFFLPWFGVNLYGATYSENGLDAHGYLYIPLLVSLATVLYLIARAGWQELPGKMPFAHSPMLFVATTVDVVLVFIAFLLKPSGLGWEVGAFLALIAGVVAVLPFAVPIYRARSHS